MKYKLMLAVAAVMAIASSLLTALGMMDLFVTAGIFILILFVIIDLGRFLLFNFVVDEWKNLRIIKYFIVIILSLLFLYSAVGIYSKMTSLVPKSIHEAMINAAGQNATLENAYVKQNRSNNLAEIAQQEYNTAIEWNKTDHQNCILRAQKAKDIAVAENNCNNTKRRLDKKASETLKEMLAKADSALTNTEEAIQRHTENKSEIATVLTTICKLTGGECDTYDGLNRALSIIIFLVIIGTDYLQIAIILAINTRKNKPRIIQNEQKQIKPSKPTPKPNIATETHIFSNVEKAELYVDAKSEDLRKNDILVECTPDNCELVATGNIEKNSTQKSIEAHKEPEKYQRTRPPESIHRKNFNCYAGPRPKNTHK